MEPAPGLSGEPLSAHARLNRIPGSGSLSASLWTPLGTVPRFWDQHHFELSP